MSATAIILISVGIPILVGVGVTIYMYVKNHPTTNGVKCKKSVENYPNNKPRRVFFLAKTGEKEGLEKVFYPTGELNKTQYWMHGKRDGAFTVYYRDGKKYITGEYRNGELLNQEVF